MRLYPIFLQYVWTSINFNGFQFQSGDVTTDLAFAENINVTKPNIGIGAYYFTDKFYVGLSAPNLLKSKHIEEKSGINAYGSEDIHTFLHLESLKYFIAFSLKNKLSLL